MGYHSYEDVIRNNARWVKEKIGEDPEYFHNLAIGQSPPFLFIGCSDSRMPLNTFTCTEPGELFIHRNIANQVSLTDINLLSILEYAVEILRVKHLIVCGHYDCGGVKAAYAGFVDGLVGNWIMPIRDLYLNNKEEIEAIPDQAARCDRLSELNAIKQLGNCCKTSIMHRAFGMGDYPTIHSWVIDIKEGLIRDLVLPVDDWKGLGLIPGDYPAGAR